MESDRGWGPGTAAVHAGIPAGAQGEPLRPSPVFAGPYHLRGPIDSAPFDYGRDANPTWSALEAAVGALDGGEAVAFASGMAAVNAVLLSRLGPGDVLVMCEDGYPKARVSVLEQLAPRGVEVRFVPTDTGRIVAALAGATAAWVETPANPGLELCDVAAVAAAAERAGAWVAVDNTLATPLGQRPLALGARFSVLSATKALAGHSDLLLGLVVARDAADASVLRAWRSQLGGIPSAFDAWLAHRSLATLDLRLARQSENALALARRLEGHPAVADVRHPGLPSHPHHALAVRQMARTGPLLAFTLASEAAAQRFLGALELVAEATSFGGVHSTAERRARWGTDRVAPGFIRFSAGCEDVADLVADVERALAA